MIVTQIYLIQIEDIEHVLQVLLIDAVGFSLIIAEQSSAKWSEVGKRQQTVADEIK